MAGHSGGAEAALAAGREAMRRGAFAGGRSFPDRDDLRDGVEAMARALARLDEGAPGVAALRAAVAAGGGFEDAFARLFRSGEVAELDAARARAASCLARLYDQNHRVVKPRRAEGSLLSYQVTEFRRLLGECRQWNRRVRELQGAVAALIAETLAPAAPAMAAE